MTMGRRLGATIPGLKQVQDPPTVPCGDCGGRLEIHQPSVDQPERLLGACVDCGEWYQVMLTEVGCRLALIPAPCRLPLDEIA
jgi:hypothetical protein